MSKVLVIDIPDRTEAALLEAKRDEGLDEKELVLAALDDYLAIRRFRRLRERMRSRAPGDLKDEDVFEQVSCEYFSTRTS